MYSLLSPSLSAQTLQLPRKSPAAEVSATIGYTEISIDYSAPAVRGREIWGGLVPYGELWRAGANEATTVCFSTAASLAEQEIAAGCYALFLLPREKEDWTLVLNRDTSLQGTSGYDESLDALRVPVAAKFARTANQERLQYEIVSQNIESGYLLLSWERLRLYVPVRVSTMERAVAAIQETLAATPDEEDWKVHLAAADFLLWVELPRPALKYALRAAEQRPSGAAHWIAARAYAALGDYANALAMAEKVQEDAEYYDARKGEIEMQTEAWKG
jgi:tetratricopeptide (TPR) repeat protein